MFLTHLLLSCRQSRQWGTTPASCPLATAVLLWAASDPSGLFAPQLATRWACLPTWDWGRTGLTLSSDTLDARILPTPGRTALPNLDPPLQAHSPPALQAPAPLHSDPLNILRPDHRQTHPKSPMNSSRRRCRWWWTKAIRGLTWRIL